MSPGKEDDRQALCRQYGLKDEAELYQLVAESKTAGPAKLLAKNLRAPVLTRFGYTEANLRRMGLGDSQLMDLGYLKKPEPSSAPPQIVAPSGHSPATEPVSMEQLDEGQKDTIQQMVKSGMRAPEMKQKGWTVGHLRKAGINPLELERCGFFLDELAQWYPPAELRRYGYGARDLRRIFRPQELRSAGFSATDMRNSGATIRELLSWGYSENDVRTAGFSIVELQREGLSRQTVDNTKKGR